MFNYLSRLLDSRSLSPHGICLLWRPELLWTHVASDLAIGLAYMTIPAGIAVFMRRRPDLPFGWIGWCFILFITACGLTHFMAIWTLWHSDYGLEALLKVVTALASIATAAILWPLIPVLAKLPSLSHWEAANADLRRTILERDGAIDALQREKAERARAEEALLQSRKMDALGQLAGGLAHDFNNLLQAIHGSLELIHRRAADAVGVRRLADGAMKAAERGARLTAQLLAFARAKPLSPEPVHVADLAADLKEMLSRTLGSGHELRYDLDSDDPPVAADRTQLELAILNLAINARDATPPGGRITISTRRHTISGSDPDLHPGEYVELRVSDTGAGMAPEVQARAFDPFFTTKPLGKGTGLGLSQVYGLAKQSGGVARISSTPGSGAAVSIFLPRFADAVRDEAKTPMRPPAIGGGLAVLVVDDDDDVRAFTVEALQLLGHTASQASDGPSALTALETSRPAIVLLDYAMPGMTGAEVARAMRQSRPYLPIVFTTGYADMVMLEQVLGPGAAVLRKPFSIGELEEAVVQGAARASSSGS